MIKRRYKVGELAASAGLTIRTIRYYDELGLLKTKERTEGGQRVYASDDLVYLKRIAELKNLGFSLEEIGGIIRLSDQDHSGELRRQKLLEHYQKKLEESEKRLLGLQEHVEELKWHIQQLSTSSAFQECPGALCPDCQFQEKCTLKCQV